MCLRCFATNRGRWFWCLNRALVHCLRQHKATRTCRRHLHKKTKLHHRHRQQMTPLRRRNHKEHRPSYRSRW